MAEVVVVQDIEVDMHFHHVSCCYHLHWLKRVMVVVGLLLEVLEVQLVDLVFLWTLEVGA